VRSFRARPRVQASLNGRLGNTRPLGRSAVDRGQRASEGEVEAASGERGPGPPRPARCGSVRERLVALSSRSPSGEWSPVDAL
jgi:hypothetical protein